MALSFISLIQITPNECLAAKFLQEKGIINQSRVCSCGSDMSSAQRTNHNNRIPTWRCNNRACDAYKGVRIDTWLDPSKLPLDTIIHFIYWWSHEQTSITFCDRELGMNKNTTVDWSNYLREVSADFLLKKQYDGKKVGGNGLIVEIDESQFTKRKNNVGRVFPSVWVFGGICRETRETFLVVVPDRTANTLLSVVRERIAEGTTVMSDCWLSYNMLGVDGTYNHLRVNHNCNFVDPISGAHTQTIERTWRKQKTTWNTPSNAYLCEFLWREDCKHRKADPFDEILSAIVAFMPPQ